MALVNDVFTQFMKRQKIHEQKYFQEDQAADFVIFFSFLGSKASVYISAKQNSLSSPWLHPDLLITSHTSLVTNHTPIVTNHQKTQLG